MKKLTPTMLLTIIVLVYLLLLPGSTGAQLDLLLHDPSPGYLANNIAEDFQGNIIIAGNSFVSKLNSIDSTWSWTTNIVPAEGSPGYIFILDLTTDATGNVYLAGKYSYSIVFGSITLTSLANTMDMFVAKMDTDGNFLWAKSFGGSAGTDEANGIDLDASGNIYIAGSHHNKYCSGPIQTAYVRDIYAAKLNGSGNLIWQKRFPPAKIQCGFGGGSVALALDNAGNIYTTGSFNGTFKFGSGTNLTITSLGNNDVFTLKLNNNGTPQWAKAGRGTATDKSSSIYVDGSGNVTVGGSYGESGAGNIEFAPITLADIDGNGDSYLASTSNAFLVKYLSNGNVAWAVNPGTVQGIFNNTISIVGKSSSELYIALERSGVKTVSYSDGSILDFIEMQNNFYDQNGWIAFKLFIREMASSSTGFVCSLKGRCGSITMANLSLDNIYCPDCSAINSCAAGDVFLVRSETTADINPPIVSRTVSEILGHTYLGSFEGHSYYMSDCPTDWNSAFFAAEEMGGNLVAISSEAEDDFLAGFAPDMFPEDPNSYYTIYGGVWTGLLATQNGGSCQYWQWTSGEPVVYTNWNAYLPDPFSLDCGTPMVAGVCMSNYCGVQGYTWKTLAYMEGIRKYIVEFDQDPGCSNPDKTYVCHNGNTLCINESSLQNHLDHGDLEGPCGPCNIPAMQALPDETLATDGNSHTSINKMDSDIKDELDFDKKMIAPDQIHVFPNPASEEIKIILPSAYQTGTLRMLSITGQEYHVVHLQGQQSMKFDLSAYASGIYLIDIRSANGHYQKKFVKL